MDSDLDSFVNFDSLDGGKDDVKSSPNFIGSLSPGTAAAAAEAAAAMSSFFSSLPPSTSAPAISPSFMPSQWPSHFPSTTIPQSTDHHLTLPVAWPTHLGDASYDLIANPAWHHKPHPQHQPSVNATGADTAQTSAYVIAETEARGLCGGVPSVDQSLSGADAVPRGFLPSSLPTHRPVQLSPPLRHGVGGSVGPQRSSPASSNVGRCQAEGTTQLHADEDAQWMFLGSSISNHGLFDTLPDSTNTPSSVAALVSDSQYNAQQHASTPLFFAAHPSTGYLEHQSPQGSRVDVGANFGGISPSQSSFPTATSSSSERLLYPLAAAEEMTPLYPTSPQNIPSRHQIHQGYDHDTHSANRFGQNAQVSSPSYATAQPALGLTESTSNTQTQPVFPIATGTTVPAQVPSVSPPAASFPQFAHVPHAPQVHTDATRPLRRRGLVGWMPNQPQQIQPPSAATRTVSMGATITPPRRAQLVALTLSAPQPASRTAIAPAAPSGLVVPAEHHADVSTPQQFAPQPHRVALGGFQLKKQTFALQQQTYTFPPRPIPSNPSSSSTGDADAFVVTRGNKRPRSGSDSSSEVPNALRQHQQDIDVQTIAVRKPRRESKSQRLNLRPDSDSEMGHNDTDGDDEEYKADGDEEDSDDYIPSRSSSPPQASSRRASKSSRGTHSPSVIPLSGAPALMPSTAPGSAGMYHRFDAGASASTMDRNRSSSSGGTQGSGSGSGKRSKGKARGSAAYALAIVTQRSMQSSAPNRRDASPNTTGLDAIRISSTSPSSPIFDLSSIDLENHPSIRKRKNHPIPLPVPVPNLNKKSRGRKVPFVLKVDPTGAVEFPEGVTPASSGGALSSPAGDGDKEEVPEPVIPGNEGSKGASRRTPSASGSRRPSSTHSRRTSVTPAPLLSGGEGDRTFVCVIPGCGKCFVRGEHLKRHVRSIHTHDKPHVCPYEGCDKTFSRRDNLGQHVRIHLQQQL